MKNIAVVLAALILIAIPTLSQTPWNTAHYANWDGLQMPISAIPWDDVTHIIIFAGGTGGNGTQSTSPYYVPQSGLETIGGPMKAAAHAHNPPRAVLLDLGLNWSFLSTWTDATMSQWAHAIAIEIQTTSNGGYDGADMDVEGGLSGVQTKIGRAAHILRDTLAALGGRMGKKLYLTCDVLSGFNTSYMAPSPDSIMYFDQCNLMTYDMYGTFGSPLYSESSCGVGFCDSSALQPWITWFSSQYGPTGVAKIGLGYNIQIYTVSRTSPCPAGSRGAYSGWTIDGSSASLFSGGTVYWDDVVKEPYLVNNARNTLVAYEDTNSTYWKGDFIRRKGLGGGMGFTLQRGYLPASTIQQYNIRDSKGNYVNSNMAAHGMWKGLTGGGAPPPILTYTITASADAHGSITPGTMSCTAGSNLIFTMSATSGYQIAAVLVDGSSVGAISSYTFTNVQANHTISLSTQVIPPISTCNYDSATAAGYKQGQAAVDTVAAQIRAVNAYKAQIPKTVSTTVHITITKDTTVTQSVPLP